MNIIDENRLTAEKLWQEHAEFVESMPSLFGVFAGVVCNLRCAMCSGHGHPKSNILSSEPKFFDTRLLEALSEPFSKASLFEFHGYCEPFITNRYWELADFAQTCSPDKTIRRVCVVTNGNFIPDEKNLLHATGKSIRKITFSVDAGTDATYQFVRGGNFSLLQENISAVVKERNKKFLKDDIEICSAFIIMKSNINEIIEHVTKFSNLGVDTVEFSILLDPGTEHINSWNVIRKDGKHFSYLDEMCIDINKVTNYLKEAQKIAKCKGINLRYCNFLSGKMQKMRPSQCWWPYLGAYISTNGDVLPCCSTINSMGNIKENSFKNIWNNNLYRQMRRDMAQDRLPVMCRGRNCPFSG